MKTYTKRDLAQLISDRYFDTHAGLSTMPNKIFTLTNLYINMLQDALLDKKVVYLRGWGKLTPCFKEGGRPVRNPKTGETIIMHDLWTVSRTKLLKKKERDQLLYTQMLEWVEEHARQKMAGYNEKKLGRAVVDSFLELILTLGDEDRIELRGLGVFYRKRLEGRMVRNPKTGEKVFKEAAYHNRFKVSKTLLKQLNA